MKPPVHLVAIILTAAFAAMSHAQDIAPRKPGELPGKRLAPPPSGLTGDKLVRVRSMADVPRISPGETFHLAFIFDIQPQWHIYWRNAGASGGPTEIKVTGPEDFAIGRTMYPRPRIIGGEEGLTYGYDSQVVLYVEVAAPPQLPAGQVMFNAKINWMVCKDICLLGRTSQVVNVPTGPSGSAGVSPLNQAVDPLVEQFKSRLPRSLEDLEDGTAEFAEGALTINLPAQGYRDAEFFPVEVPGVTYGEAAVKAQGERLVIRVPVAVEPKNSLGQPMRIIGTVGFGKSQTDPCHDIEIALPAT